MAQPNGDKDDARVPRVSQGFQDAITFAAIPKYAEDRRMYVRSLTLAGRGRHLAVGLSLAIIGCAVQPAVGIIDDEKFGSPADAETPVADTVGAVEERREQRIVKVIESKKEPIIDGMFIGRRNKLDAKAEERLALIFKLAMENAGISDHDAFMESVGESIYAKLPKKQRAVIDGMFPRDELAEAAADMPSTPEIIAPGRRVG